MAATTYLAANDQNAQNSDQIFNCLRQSLTPEVYSKVANEKQTYTIRVRNEDVYDGVCFLKAIIDIAYTNTRSSATVIRYNLSSLDTYMATLKDSDIVAFHRYVKDNVNKLAAAGESTNDLLVNLFKAYRSVKDKAFLAWVASKKSNWLKGTLPLATNGTALMELAEGFYKDAVATGEWLKLTDEEEKIIALEAQLRQATAQQNLKRKEKIKKKKKGEKEKNGQQVKWAWKLHPPNAGQRHTKLFEGKMYHWCPKHNKWTIHKPDECHLEEKKEPKTRIKTEEKEKMGNEEKKRLKQLALQMIMDLSSDEESVY